MLSEPPCRFGYNKTASLLVLIAKVLKMKLSEEELKKISDCLCNLATECHFMYDAAKLHSFLIGCRDSSSFMVISHLQDVLRRADVLLEDLRCVSASLDDLLVKEKTLNDVERA